MDKGDYIAIEDNEVFSNTWWGSSAESAIVIAEATHIDQYDGAKIFLQRNVVYDNRNFIPFLNSTRGERRVRVTAGLSTARSTKLTSLTGQVNTLLPDFLVHSCNI